MNDDNDDSASSGDDAHGSHADDLLDSADQFTRLLGDLYGTADEFSRLLVDSFPPVQPDTSVWDGIEARISPRSANDPTVSQLPPPSGDRPGTQGTLVSRLVPFLAVAAVLLGLVGTVFIAERAIGGGVVSASDGIVRQLADPSTGELALTVVTADDGFSVATATSLPTLDRSETYQLWSVIGDEVVSVGLLGSNPQNVDFRIEGSPSVLALTVEVAGGVAVSQSSPVAVWQSS